MSAPAPETPQTAVILRPRDPILVRDARPFSADPGARAFTLDFPLPKTTAGALRTYIGAPKNGTWTQQDADAAKQIVVHGPLLLGRAPGEGDWTVFVHAPADVVLYEKDDKVGLFQLRPWAEMTRATDLPHGLLPLTVSEDAKPEPTAPRFWPLNAVTGWLGATDGAAWVAQLGRDALRAGRVQRQPPPDALTAGIAELKGLGRRALPRDSRTHVSIARDSGTALTGARFTTEALAFAGEPLPARPADLAGRLRPERTDRPASALLCRVQTDIEWQPAGVLPLGGERRLAELGPGTWPPPSLPADATIGTRLRLLLATPALFEGGWRPGWIDDPGWPPPWRDSDRPPRLRLIAVAAGRRVPVSGWDLAAGGPRPTRYAVSAGSVYFFEVANKDVRLTADLLRALWLAPVSDLPADRNEGFGLAVPGIW